LSSHSNYKILWEWSNDFITILQSTGRPKNVAKALIRERKTNVQSTVNENSKNNIINEVGSSENLYLGSEKSESESDKKVDGFKS
jgi:hypothetical protein